MPPGDRFIRFPTDLLEALLHTRLNGAQWGILLWVVRQTFGWNRNTTPFSWYRIATDLVMDRGGVVRAGHRLVRSGILYLEGDEIGIQQDDALWLCAGVPAPGAMTGVIDDRHHRKGVTGIIESGDGNQRMRRQASSLFRRAKDSSKDRIKKKRKTGPLPDIARQPFENGALSERHHPAGAARPIRGKYDCLSQDR
jgi:phage replication O-like protein O